MHKLLHIQPSMIICVKIQLIPNTSHCIGSLDCDRQVEKNQIAESLTVGPAVQIIIEFHSNGSCQSNVCSLIPLFLRTGGTMTEKDWIDSNPDSQDKFLIMSLINSNHSPTLNIYIYEHSSINSNRFLKYILQIFLVFPKKSFTLKDLQHSF